MAPDSHVDLNKKTTAELAELLERQNKLLNNKSLLAKLPDKGAKIQSQKQNIEKFYNQRLNEVNTAADLFSNLKISDSKEVDSDDDADATKESLSDQNGSANKSSKPEVFYPNLGRRIDEKPSDTNKRLNTIQIKSNMGKKIDEKWRTSTKEESAARYPTGLCIDARLLSLRESVKLQEEHVARIKEAQVHAATIYLRSDENSQSSSLNDYVPDPLTRMVYREKEEESDLED